jgi:hypothetical protein
MIQQHHIIFTILKNTLKTEHKKKVTVISKENEGKVETSKATVNRTQALCSFPCANRTEIKAATFFKVIPL